MPRLKVGRGGKKGFFLQQSLGAVRKMRIRFQVSGFPNRVSISQIYCSTIFKKLFGRHDNTFKT